MRSYNPATARYCGLGSSLFARHYLGNHYYFLFLRLLRCFSSPGWLLAVTHLQCARLSHSEISGFTLVCSYPKLIAAYHVLHRLLVPRHPPYALIRFKYCYLITQITPFILLPYYYLSNLRCQGCFCCRGATKTNCFPNMSKNFSVPDDCSSRQIAELSGLEPPVGPEPIILLIFQMNEYLLYPFSCGGYRSRTDDPLRARQML